MPSYQESDESERRNVENIMISEDVFKHFLRGNMLLCASKPTDTSTTGKTGKTCQTNYGEVETVWCCP